MKLIESKAELVLQQEGLEGVYKQIEFCGRTCYKSTDKITDESAKPFVERMIASKHTAMLEHGTVYLIIKWWHIIKFIKYLFNPYSKIHRYKYITTNLRVLVEKDWLDDLKYLCYPTKFHERRYTMRFDGDIHLYKDTTRHRVMSYAIESTRFCNYMKEKFNMSVSFMQPTWLKDEFVEEFKEDCKTLENIYFKWIKKGLRAEEAAYFLCQGTAAEFCVTGFASDWRFFFDLRYYGKTGKPHPDMELLASKAKHEFVKGGLWHHIMKYPSKFDKDDTEGKD